MGVSGLGWVWVGFKAQGFLDLRILGLKSPGSLQCLRQRKGSTLEGFRATVHVHRKPLKTCAPSRGGLYVLEFT